MGRVIGQLGRFCLYSDSYVEGECPPLAGEGGAPALPGSFTFTYGPSAGGLLESVRVDMDTLGEYIRRVAVYPLYKEREIRVLGKGVDDVLLLVERVNGAFSASHSIAFLTAVERAMGVEVDPDVLYLRILQVELERVRNNLFVIERLVESAGFLVPMYQLLYLVEKVNRRIGKVFGHRYFFGVNSLGRVRLEGEKVDLSDVEKEFREVYEGILENRIFIDRLQGNGVVRDERSIGPAARAAGLIYDARLEEETLPYRDFDFKVVKYDSADAFGRLVVRGEEVFESLRIISEVNVRQKEYEARPREGEGIGRVESPSGDLAYYVKVDRESRVTDVSLLSPSSVNLRLFSKSMVRNIFTDFPFNWESFGIWVSEVGVRFT
jgi:Ni,Fe-hydrogenase III large subunit